MSGVFSSARSSLRNLGRLSGVRWGLASGNTTRRVFSSTVNPSSVRRSGISLASSLLAGTAVLYGGYHALVKENGVKIFPLVDAATGTQPQPSVISETKEHALYLWIHLKPEANIKQCVKTAASLQEMIKKVCPPEDTDESDEVIGGVGFGYNFYKQATCNKETNVVPYAYPHRKGYNGAMPSTGGDVFIHAKSNSRSKLYELCQQVLKSFPQGTIDSAEDVYGWVYQNGRDLSGFIDGTENPADEDDRLQIAVNDKCGGSYVITQRWIHLFDVINSQKEKTLENWVGRSRPDSIEQNKKSASAHVARMVGTTTPGQKKPFEMVRQSQPYGTVCGESGLFFIGYAASPENFEYMLDRMVGADSDGLCDDVMRLSKCVSGNYWYFPSEEKLKQFRQ